MDEYPRNYLKYQKIISNFYISVKSLIKCVCVYAYVGHMEILYSNPLAKCQKNQVSDFAVVLEQSKVAITSDLKLVCVKKNEKSQYAMLTISKEKVFMK